MIITLKGATFTHKLDLNSWMIISDLVGVTSSNTVTKVTKGDTYTTTFTINTGCTLTKENVSVVCNGVTKTLTWDKLTEGGKATLSFTPDATVYISIKATSTQVQPETPSTPTSHTFTINPTPTSATVTLSATGYSTVSGTGSNSITVANGTTVNWSVSANGYTTRTGNWTISGGNKTENITLTASSSTNVTLTIVPDPADARVTFIKDGSSLTATNNTVSVPNGSKVSVQVSKNGYITVNTSYTLTSNRTETITLTEASDVIVVTEYPYVVTTWEQGSYSAAGLSDEVGRIRAGYFSVEPNSTIDMQLNGNWQGYMCYPTDTSHALMGTQSWTQSEIFNVGSHNEKVLIVLKNTSNAKITPSDYSEADGGVITINAPVVQETVTTYTSSDLVVGGLTTATATVNTTEKNRLRTGLLECQAGDTVKVTLPEGLICYVAYMETGVVPMKFSSWSAAGATVEIPVPYTGSFCVVIAYSDKKTTFSDTSAFTGTIELLR